MLNTDRLCLGCMNEIGGARVCPVCGHDVSEQNPGTTLPTKFWLRDRYMVGRVLAVNGESITYIGWDNADDLTVYIREYFPAGIACRNPDRTVTMLPDKKYLFNEGLLDFLTLNRNLASIVLPALTKTYTAFEENGTAYAISAAVSGKSLESFLKENGGALKWEQARSLFLPLLDTLSELHAARIVHGGISTDTIMINLEGKLRLGGFSIIRMRQNGSDFNARIFDGYAAPEQYVGTDLPTAASDVYALSAVLFRVLIGTVPPAANERMRRESLSVPARFANELPRQVLVALANGLQLETTKRTASIDAFRNELVYGETNVKRAPRQPQRQITAASAADYPAKRIYEAPAENNGKQNKKNKDGNAHKKSNTPIIILVSALITLIVLGILYSLAAPKLGLPGISKVFGKKKSSESTSQTDNSSESKGTGEMIRMPDLSDLSIYNSDLINTVEYKNLQNLKDSVHIVYQGQFNKNVDVGVIFDQSVKAGDEIEVGSELVVTFSLGPETISFPSVRGLSKSEALDKLQTLGFKCVSITYRHTEDESLNETVLSWTVNNQIDISSGTDISPYDEIILELAKAD